MNDRIEAAAQRLKSLIDYTRETGVKTSNAQINLLKKFSLEDQQEIITRVQLRDNELAGGAR